MRKIWFKCGICLLALILILLSISVVVRLIPYPPLKDSFSYSSAIYDDSQNLLRLTTAKDERYRLWKPLSEFPQQFIDTVLFQEDQLFYWHPGFNPYGLMRGAWSTYVLSAYPQGGSTISMQLARILWKINSRSLQGKIEQILRAVQLEMMYSKDEILEAYLNFAPYGRNVEGAATASIIYFDKPVEQINLPELMTLAIFPKNPNSYLKQSQSSLINNELYQARNVLYKRWIEKYTQDKIWQNSFNLPYKLRKLEDLPFLAPHFTDQLLSQYPNASILNSSLNLNLQTIVEKINANYLAQIQDTGIKNTAILLVDNRDMKVKALVGSGNYFNNMIEGQINGTNIKRSPGSTLKPFVYALSFDQGITHPKTVLADIATSFSEYSPENSDGEFFGPVTVEQALNRSRNIPAITVASQLKQPNLYQFLQQAEINFPYLQSHYGLSIVLGGAEISAQQLATLYAMLANKGLWQPLVWLQDDRNPQINFMPKQLLSPEASFMLSDILAKAQRPDIYNKALKTKLPLHWKTGTSNGLRDAWTAGYFGNYTLIVWLGNFNNQTDPHLIGRIVATPLFLQLADAIIAHEHTNIKANQQIPTNLKQIAVCAADGNLPNKWCQQQTNTWFIPGTSPITVSQIFQPVMLENATGIMACPPYDATKDHQEIFEFWPSDLQQVFTQAGITKRKPIPNPKCLNVQQINNLHALVTNSPKITSPDNHNIYTIRHASEHNNILLTAKTGGDVRKLYWFINNIYLGEVETQQILFWRPELSGVYNVSVIDDQGRSHVVSVTIKLSN